VVADDRFRSDCASASFRGDHWRAGHVCVTCLDGLRILDLASLLCKERKEHSRIKVLQARLDSFRSHLGLLRPVLHNGRCRGVVISFQQQKGR
jgi:hypothetical protein